MIFKCPVCGKDFRAETDGVVRCPSCNAEVQVHLSMYAGTSWDRAGHGKWPEAFFSDIKDAISNPVQFFERVAEGRGWVRPWLFAVVIFTGVFLIAAAYQAGFNIMASGPLFSGAAAGAVGALSAVLTPLSIGTIILLGMIAIPVGSSFALLMQAAVYHLCLMILGARSRGFESTFRVTCYSMCPQVFQIVPFFGGIVAWGWQLALTIIGIKVAHRTSYGRSALAVFLPSIICCGAAIIFATAVAGAIVAAIATAAK